MLEYNRSKAETDMQQESQQPNFILQGTRKRVSRKTDQSSGKIKQSRISLSKLTNLARLAMKGGKKKAQLTKIRNQNGDTRLER